MRNIGIGLAVVTVALTTLAMKPADEAATPEFYTTQVQPILQNNCYKCHGGDAHRGGLSLNTRATMLTGGHHGPAIVPGDPSTSLLVTLIKHEGKGDDPMSMPPDPRPKLSDTDIATISRWIKAGAVMP
jgi:cytochrome c